MAKRCNRLKRDGTRCRRGPGCRIQHKGPDVRAAEIAVATTDGDLTLDDYATETAGDVIRPFNQSGMLIEPDGVEQISVDQIMNVLADPTLVGRTISPRTSGTDVVIEASQGVAVTLPGSDLRFKIDTKLITHPSNRTSEHSFADEVSVVADELGDDIDAFLQHMQPVIDSGGAWIGLWKADDVIELNMTVIVKELHEQEALEIGQRWDQKAVYHLGRKTLIPIGGTGGKSIYSTDHSEDAPDSKLRQRLREWFAKQRPRPT